MPPTSLAKKAFIDCCARHNMAGSNYSQGDGCLRRTAIRTQAANGLTLKHYQANLSIINLCYSVFIISQTDLHLLFWMCWYDGPKSAPDSSSAQSTIFVRTVPSTRAPGRSGCAAQSSAVGRSRRKASFAYRLWGKPTGPLISDFTCGFVFGAARCFQGPGTENLEVIAGFCVHKFWVLAVTNFRCHAGSSPTPSRSKVSTITPVTWKMCVHICVQ